jgi:hypothetical protein
MKSSKHKSSGKSAGKRVDRNLFNILTLTRKPFMGKKTVNIEEEAHKKAKILSAETGLDIGQIIGLLLMDTSEKEIRKLAKEKKS